MESLIQSERPRILTLGEIAPYDMRLAAALIDSGRVGCGPGADAGVGRGVIDMRGWTLVNLIARWESGASDDTIESRLTENICADMWVCDVRTTVRRPNYAQGSLWKGQADYFNSLNSGIDFTLVTKNNCYDLAISPDPTPLDNVRGVFRNSCPFGLVLTCGANFDAWFTYTRSLTESGVLPMEAIVTFSGIRLRTGSYLGSSFDEAKTKVQELLRAA